MENFKINFVNNISNDYFPNNTTSDFRVKLPYPLDFSHKNIEVGLTSIHFPNKIVNIRHNYNQIQIFRYKTKFKPIILPSKYYTTVHEIIDFIHLQTKKYLFTKKIDGISTKIRGIEIKFSDKKVSISLKRKFRIFLGSDICDILGIPFSQNSFTGDITGGIVENALSVPNSVFVLLDIIRDQYFGDKKMKIIKTIFCSNKSNVTSKSFYPIEYCDLHKTHFESFNIKFVDAKMKLIKFVDEKIFMQLHFQEKV